MVVEPEAQYRKVTIRYIQKKACNNTGKINISG